ncbi:MAG: ATP-binding protein [Bacteroidia bacterium]
MEIENPFILTSYESPAYFCDRAAEAKRLQTAFRARRNITLIAQRKIGKTGLIKHVFYQMNRSKQAVCLYVDIMRTQNLEDFVNVLAKAIIGKLDSKPVAVIKKILELLSSFRPQISYDALTSEPDVTLTLSNDKDTVLSLDKIFEYLKEQSRTKMVIVAIDEFQQILEYPEKNVEAHLRTFIQHLTNVKFIFSGSMKHLMIKMFHEANRPFYQSTEWMSLDKIDAGVYLSFIKAHFEKAKRKIREEDIKYMIEWTRNHTYYVQALCSELYETHEKIITRDIIHHAMHELLLKNENIYFSYRNLLTSQQWNLLEALAKEDGVKNILAQSFLRKHKLSATSSVKTTLKALVDREMIVQDDDGTYHVYDVFFSRWLERL